METTHALAYARRHRPRFVAELKEFLRFPSVSSQPEHSKDISSCAKWLAGHLKKIGLDTVRIVPTHGNPIIYGSWQRASGRPTLLIYGHYDVLPGEPLDQWQTSPFTPVVKGKNIYGRGASDDKGQLFCHLKAIESFLNGVGRLPINVKCLFEGEEEIGSPHLPGFLERNKRALRADAAVISDTRMIAADRPAISYAQRGGLRAEINVRGSDHELHSGSFGGAIHNPLQALCEIIAGLHDDQNRVAIPGFYDDVVECSDKERAYMERTGPSDEKIRQAAELEHSWGEPGYTLYERTTTRPALTVNGMVGGHTGAGHKASIPTRAIAKLSFRLVPNQEPAKIGRLFRNRIADLAPPTVRVCARTLSPIRPALMDRSHPAMKIAAFAYKKGFGTSPVFLRSGGSIPVINALQDDLDIPVVLMGFGLPDDHIHGPNEKFHLPTLFHAIDTSIWHLAASAAGAERASKQPEHRVEEWSGPWR
jgi:acetylornithine deacetylase/succinyl-diaminopimelate desuccinylase-like protein